MHTYLICYEPRSTDSEIERARIDETFKALFPTYWHFSGATWIVQTTHEPISEYKQLSEALGPNRRLLLVYCSPDNGVWTTTDDNAPKWLNARSVGDES